MGLGLPVALSEARLKRSEKLRQQLQGSFTEVLQRLDSTERKESRLHQAWLSSGAVAAKSLLVTGDLTIIYRGLTIIYGDISG